MNKFKIITAIMLFTISTNNAKAEEKKLLGHGYDFVGNGKQDLECFKSIYLKENLPNKEINLEDNKSNIRKAIEYQIPIIKKRRKKSSLKNKYLDKKKLITSSNRINQLLSEKKLSNFNNYFDSYLIRGEDNCGNTQFTAYFSPVIEVKSKPDNKYKYPLYKKPNKWPNGKKLTRKEIDSENKLKGENLELGYSSSLLENYFLQVQGSGFIQFLDTNEKYTFQFGGQNGYKYNSLGRYLVENNYIKPEKISLDSIKEFFKNNPEKLEPFLNINPSYTFFNKRKSKPRGALGTSVIEKVSIAVDPKYIPLGSILVAEIPELDNEGKVKNHKLTLLIAQDVGGAIRGTGHVDLYMGIGKKAQGMASKMHHYGRLWLLVPKD